MVTTALDHLNEVRSVPMYLFQFTFLDIVKPGEDLSQGL